MSNLITAEKKFMNTTITFQVVQHPGIGTVDINEAIGAGFGEFDRIVKQFTRFNEDSELANLNRNSGKWTKVSEEMFMLVEKMLELSETSGGHFDPTIIDFLETYGYDKNYDFSKLDQPELDALVKKIADTRPSWREIQLDKGSSSIKLAENQRLDLGGIGKGYAIDCAYTKLDKFPDFLIDAGGDLRVKGVNADDEPWRLGLKHIIPGETKQEIIIGHIDSPDIALACSGSWARRVKQFHHIINPTTGEPATEMLTVYVTAKTATVSDAWATALFVGGVPLLERLPAGVEAMLIDVNQKAVTTENWRGGINNDK